MSKIIATVRIRKQATVAADGTATIQTDRVRDGQQLVIQSAAFRNRTGARGAATLQILNDPITYPLAYEPSPPINQWLTYDTEQHLNDGEQLQVSQSSCLASDVLDLIIVGYTVDKPSPDEVRNA